jgi:hypothetical protein
MAPARDTARKIAGMLGSASWSVQHGAALALALPAVVLGLVPVRLGVVLAVSLAIAGTGHFVVEARRRIARRRDADRLLAAIETDRIPEKLHWRAAELTCTRQRRALARALRNLLRALELPPTMFPVPVNRVALRRNRRAVEALAARLAAVELPVHPRGILLVRQLLGGSPYSPFYDVEAEGELRAALVRVRTEIEPR